MNTIGLVYFLFALLLVGGAIRFVEYQWPDNPVVQAIAVIY